MDVKTVRIVGPLIFMLSRLRTLHFVKSPGPVYHTLKTVYNIVSAVNFIMPGLEYAMIWSNRQKRAMNLVVFSLINFMGTVMAQERGTIFQLFYLLRNKQYKTILAVESCLF